MPDVTSQQIMEATKIGDIVTLTRWHKRGLIPQPEVRTHPNGRGKMAYWPAWVLERCVRIKQWQKSGKTLGEIEELLGSDWKQAEHRHKRRYRFAEASDRMARSAALMNLQDAVERHFRRWMSAQKKHMGKTNVSLIAGEVIDTAILLMERGINPVLIVSDEISCVTADFAVSHYLSHASSVECAVFVVPMLDEVSTYFVASGRKFTKPTVRPVETVIERTSDGLRERKFSLLDDWDFEIAAPKQPAKQRNKQ
jgi:DNA-binding transcriptional MerR regulator